MMSGDSSTPPPPPETHRAEGALVELMREGDFPAAGQVEAASPRNRESLRRADSSLGHRRRRLGMLLALDLALLVAVIVWPMGSPYLDSGAPPRRPGSFAVGDQGLVEQAVAQAAANRFDAAITDLELHLSTHPGLGATERDLVNRALAIFASRAGREADGVAFEARLGNRPAAQKLLARAAAAEQAGRFDDMRAALTAIVAMGDAPPSILAKMAEMLLRSGDGTPLEPARADGKPR